MILLLETMVAAGFDVTLFVVRAQNGNPVTIGIDRVDLHGFSERFIRAFQPPNITSSIVLKLRKASRSGILFRPYDLYVGVDPMGIAFTGPLARAADSPLVYISFELIFSDELITSQEKLLKNQEVFWSQRARRILIQDEERRDALVRENDLGDDVFSYVPVSRRPTSIDRPKHLVREQFGLPVDQTLILFTGSFSTFNGYLLLPFIVPKLPESCTLVIHSRTSLASRMGCFVEQLSRSHNVLLTSKPLDPMEYGAFVSSCDIGLALYQASYDNMMHGKNIYHIGLASGKIADYACFGLPTICTRLPGTEAYMKQYKCGECIEDLCDFPAMVKAIQNKYDIYSAGARRFFSERLDPVKPMATFVEEINGL